MTKRASLGRRSLFTGALLAALAQTGCSASATRAHEASMEAPGAIVARVFTEPSLVARWKSMRDVEVRLQGPLPEGSRIARTDSCGAVAFEGLPDGTYSLRAAREGLETFVENIAVTRGKDAMIDVKLKAQDSGGGPTVSSSGCKLGRRLAGPLPMYTVDALQNDVQGCLVIKCVVTSEGAVRDCRTLESLPRLTQPALNALEHQRYEAPICDGKPADMDYTFRIYFRMPR